MAHMRLAIIIFVILLTTSNCEGFEPKHVTYNYYSPGSLRVRYTGIKRVILDEVRDFLENEWSSNAAILFNSGDISLSQFRLSMLQLSWTHQQYGMNGHWWERPWYESRLPDKNGAPKPQSYTIGRTGDIINIGFIRVNENFRFKLKQYRKNLSRRWKFKFKPRITFNTNDIVSAATASFIFTYYHLMIRRFRFEIQVGYRRGIKEFVEFRIEMLNL